MATLAELFVQAELSLAAYANVVVGKPNSQALKDAGMVDAQAVRFAIRWRIVDTIRDAGTGLSATVFEEIATNRRYLAIRGTDERIDVATDVINVALIGTTALQPQYLALRAKVRAWLDNGTLPPYFAVTGHSLGGFLAVGIAAEFSANVEHAYLYNAPGFNGVLGIATAPILRALGIVAPIGATKVSNIRADAGISPIAGLGAQLAPPIRVMIENQLKADVPNPPAARNHSQDVLTDALALYALFGAIDPALTVAQISDILKVASAQNGRTLESSLDALRQIFGFTAATQIENRESFYDNLYNLQTHPLVRSIANTESGSNASAGRIVPLVGISADELASRARSDFGYLFALSTLSPFAVIRSDNVFSATQAELYANWQTDKSLTAMDWSAGGGSFSDTYLRDRAQFLLWKNQKNLNDIADGVSILRKDHGAESYLFTDKTLKDSQNQDYNIRVVGGSALQQIDPIRISFASDQGDSLQGGNYADHLYGGGRGDTLAGNGGDDYLEGGAGDDRLSGDAGDDTLIGGAGIDTLIGGADNDVLQGGKGDDVLQGGAGNDVYLIRAGDGRDTISDREGRNSLIYTDASGKHSVLAVPAFAVAGQSNTWTGYLAGGVQVMFTRNSPLTAMLADGAQIVIDDYQDGDFGIQLKDLAQSEPEATGITLLGDLEPVHLTPILDEEGQAVAWEYAEDERGNVIVDPSTPAPDRVDWLFGTESDDFIAGVGGEDWIYGRDGADRLQGGTGVDYIYGEGGDDVIEGQDDTSTDTAIDRISGGAGDDWIFATAKCDIDEAMAHANDAIAHADEPEIDSRGAHMMGEAGDDVIVGSAGQDRIAGGAGGDILIGGGGEDSIWGDADFEWLFNGQFGTDQGTAAEDADAIYGGGGGDWIRGGLGDDFIDGGDGDDFIFGEGGSDTLFGGAGNDNIFAIVNETNQIVFDDSGDYIDGGDGNDWIFGSAGDNILLGGAGDDSINGFGGNDYVDGGDGNDRIQGNDAHGGPGNDVVSGTPGADTLYGDSGDDVLSGWDSGGYAPYAIEFVDGDDWLYGGAGDDTYIFKRGAGSAHIVDDSGINRIVLRSYEALSSAPGVLGMYAPIAAGSIRIEVEDGIYKLIYGDAGDSVDFDPSLGGAMPLIELNRVGMGVSDDNSADPGPLNGPPSLEGAIEVVPMSDIQVTQNSAPEGGTLIAAEGFSNILVGNSGNDILLGAAFGDVLTGGLGDDTLDGGESGDRYVFNVGDGIDVVSDSGAQGTDTLVFGPGISPDALSLGTGSLLIRIGGSGDAVHIEGFDLDDAGTTGGIERFEFADGSVLTHAQLVSRGFDLLGNDGDDIAFGTNLVDRFHESAGNDSLIGGAGDDIYYFGVGSGQDVVVDLDATPNNSDTVVLGGGITTENLIIFRDASLLTLTVTGTDDRLAIQWQPQDGYAIERIQFADGTIWDGIMLESQAVPEFPADAGTGATDGSGALPVDTNPIHAGDGTPTGETSEIGTGGALPAETTDSGAGEPASEDSHQVADGVTQPGDSAQAESLAGAAIGKDATQIDSAGAEFAAAGPTNAGPNAQTDVEANANAGTASAEIGTIDTAAEAPSGAEAVPIADLVTTPTAIDAAPAANDHDSAKSPVAQAGGGSATVLPNFSSTSIQSRQDAFVAALGVIGASNIGSAAELPRSNVKPLDAVGAQFASEQTVSATGPASFFAPLRAEQPNMQAWLDHWLGPRARAAAGAQEIASKPTSEDAELPSAQDLAPLNLPGDLPETRPEAMLSSEEIAQGYEDIAIWLDANPGIEQGAGPNGVPPQKNLFAILAPGSAGVGEIASTAWFGQSPGMAAIGGEALQPLRGIREGYTALAVM